MGAVNCAEAGNEDKGVDKMNAACPAGSLDSNGHWAFQGAAVAVDETWGVGRTGQTKEKCRAKIDDYDALYKE